MDGEIDIGRSPSGANIFIGECEDNLNIFKVPQGSPEVCVQLNRQLQLEINRTLCKLQTILDNNLEEQRRITHQQFTISAVAKGCILKTNKKPITLFAAPYFRDVKGCVAPENEDAILKKKRNDVDAYLMPPRPWIDAEHNLLVKAVYDNALKVQIQPLLNRASFLRSKIEKELLPDEEEEELTDALSGIDEEIERIKRKPKHVLIQEMTGSIDWLKVSTVYMSGTRNPEECEAMWENVLHHKVNRQKFTPKEDSALVKIARRKKERNWDLIAKTLNTNRTAIQCLERYQSFLNADILRRYWTPEEDAHLVNVIQQCRIGNHIPWHQVCYYMDGRSRTQVFNRWHRHIKPECQPRDWSVEEDAVLHAAVQKYKEDWPQISEFIPGRTNFQCRERYCKFLAPDLLFGGWTLEEDRRLMKLIAIHGERKWSKICKEFDTRNSFACCQRAQLLRSRNSRLYNSLIRRCRNGESMDELLKKQYVQTKKFSYISDKRKEVRDKSTELYKREMFKITGLDPEADNFEVTLKSLKRLSETLLPSAEEIELPPITPGYQCFHRHEKLMQMIKEEEAMERGLPSSSEEEEVEVSSSSSASEKVGTEDEEELNRQLDTIFFPRAAAGFKKFKRKFVARSSKDDVDYQILKSIIFKAFDVESEPVETTIYNGVDFSYSIQRLMDMLVLPPSGNGMLPVIPPNLSTLTAMLIFLVTRKLLERSASAEITDQALENFKAVTSDHSNFPRKCHLCRRKDKQIEVAPDEVCECALILELRQRYILLRERFLSVFLWPALLSSVQLTNEQFSWIKNHPENVPEMPRSQSQAPPPKKRRRRRRAVKVELTSSSSEEDEDCMY